MVDSDYYVPPQHRENHPTPTPSTLPPQNVGCMEVCHGDCDLSPPSFFLLQNVSRAHSPGTYGPFSQKCTLFFQRPGTRISWSHGVFGKRKTPLQNSSRRGAFQTFFFCFGCSSPLYCRYTVKVPFVSPGGYIFQGSNITMGNNRCQNLPGSKCFRLKNDQN